MTEPLSEFEAECRLRKELGLSAFGMVEHQEVPWQIRILIELIARNRNAR